MIIRLGIVHRQKRMERNSIGGPEELHTFAARMNVTFDMEDQAIADDISTEVEVPHVIEVPIPFSAIVFLDKLVVAICLSERRIVEEVGSLACCMIDIV